jgi:hypothetical protein
VGTLIQLACFWGISILNESKVEPKPKLEKISCLSEFNQFVKDYPKRKVQAVCAYCNSWVYDGYTDKKGLFRCNRCKDDIVDLTKEEERTRVI